MSSLLVAIYELAAALQSAVLASCTRQVDPGVAWIQWQRRKFRTIGHYRVRRSPLQMSERFCLPRWWPLSQTTCTLEYSRAAHQFRRGSPFPNFFAHYDSLVLQSTCTTSRLAPCFAVRLTPGSNGHQGYFAP